jgi:hypothetical protein
MFNTQYKTSHRVYRLCLASFRYYITLSYCVQKDLLVSSSEIFVYKNVLTDRTIKFAELFDMFKKV